MAATIIQTLPALSFTENLPNIIVSEVSEIAYLYVSISDQEIVSDVTLSPDANKQIKIYTRQLVRHIPALASPGTVSTFLPQLIIRLKIGAQTLTQQGKIIPGGIDANMPDMTDYLARNFLTWQPQVIDTTPAQPQFLALVKSDRYTKTELHSTLVASNGATYTKMIDSIASPLIYAQIDTSFAKIWADFCTSNNLVPISYDVFGKSYLPNNPTPEMRPFSQRYIIRKAQHNDTCFGFINTLGGFDTLMMQGQIVLKPEGESETFTNNEQEAELLNGYKSFWEVSTGSIETNLMAAQYQDFLKSTNRWIYRNGWQKIIIDEYKVEHTPLELNAYTFKFHMAEKNERRYFDREELPAPTLPTRYCHE